MLKEMSSQSSISPLILFAARFVTDTSNATQAAQDATKVIPIVFTTAHDAVGDGQVDSLARPGGNLAGLSIVALDLNGKRLEILKQTFPRISRVGFLTRIGPATGEHRFNEAESVAKGLSSLLLKTVYR